MKLVTLLERIKKTVSEIKPFEANQAGENAERKAEANSLLLLAIDKAEEADSGSIGVHEPVTERPEQTGMKGHELIKLIQENQLEDFELRFSFTDGHNGFPNIRTFKVSGISDIGYSEKVVDFEGEEK